MRTWIAFMLLITSALAYGQAGMPQRIEVQDGVSSLAKISAKDPTRIRVEGAIIQDVLGNLFHREKSPAGELIVEEDKQRGEIFVRPAQPGSIKPINLFVMTQRATYTLLLQPVDMPADTVVLVDRTQRRAPDGPKPVAKASSGQGADIRPLFEAMATDRIPHDIAVRDVGREIHLRAGARFTLQRLYESPRLRGERYLLTNITAIPLQLAEQEFYVDGVIAVAIERADLPAGESTLVFVVRKLAEQ